jgi:DNA repair exonuclease SbcCD ATPase subunit
MINSDAPAPYRKLGKVRQFSEELVASHAQYFPAIPELRAHSEQIMAAKNDLVAARNNHRKNFGRELKRKCDLQSRLKEKKRRLEEIPGELSARENKNYNAQVLIDRLKKHDSAISKIIRALAYAYTPHLITRERTEEFKADLKKCGEMPGVLGRGLQPNTITRGIEGVQKRAETEAVRVAVWARWMVIVAVIPFLNGLMLQLAVDPFSIFGDLGTPLYYASLGFLFIGIVGFYFNQEIRSTARQEVKKEYIKFRKAVNEIRARLETKGHDYQRELQNLREERRWLPGEIAGLEGKIMRIKYEFITLQCTVDDWPQDPKYPLDAMFPEEGKVLNSLQSSLPAIEAAAKEARGNFSQELKKMKGRLDRS